MEPDLELVQVRHDQSFKVWSHGYPYRTVRWHFHPEYELHFVTATQGTRYVGDDIGPFTVGDLVLAGPNLPHNWISDVPAGEVVVERCLVLQFTSAFISDCLSTFPELRFAAPLLSEAYRGIRFNAATADAIGRRMRSLLDATGARRIGLFRRNPGLHRSRRGADAARQHRFQAESFGLHVGHHERCPTAYRPSSDERIERT